MDMWQLNALTPYPAMGVRIRGNSGFVPSFPTVGKRTVARFQTISFPVGVSWKDSSNTDSTVSEEIRCVNERHPPLQGV